MFTEVAQLGARTVGFHNFNLRIFNLRVSNPDKSIVVTFKLSKPTTATTTNNTNTNNNDNNNNNNTTTTTTTTNNNNNNYYMLFDTMSDFNVPGSRPEKNDEISENDVIQHTII